MWICDVWMRVLVKLKMFFFVWALKDKVYYSFQFLKFTSIYIYIYLSMDPEKSIKKFSKNILTEKSGITIT